MIAGLAGERVEIPLQGIPIYLSLHNANLNNLGLTLSKGRFSMGGMASKLEAVKFAVSAGIETHIAHGRHPERLAGIVAGNGISTRFPVKPATMLG